MNYKPFLLLIPLTVIIFLQSDNVDYNLKKNPSLLKLPKTKLNQDQKQSQLQDLIKKYENYCLGGRSRSTLSKSEQHKYFSEGPCSPIIMIPGFLATSLQVEINCEELQTYNPRIFYNCGWNTCSSLNIFGSRPANEYRVWLASLFSPSNIIQFTDNETCFGDLVSLYYSVENNSLQNFKGLKLTWVGNTPETRTIENGCGSQTISNLSENALIQTCEVKGFSDLISLFEAMGYQSGINLQAIPYDFRKSIVDSETQKSIPKAIDLMNKLNGKKSIIVAHSLGNLHLLQALSSLSIQQKQNQIAHYISIAAPFIGAPKAFISLLGGGDPQYIKNIFGYDIGINFYSQYKFTESCPSQFDIIPKDIFKRFENEDWLKEIKNRINYEQNYNNHTGKVPLDFIFPPKHEECYSKNTFIKERTQNSNNNCTSYLIDQAFEPFLQINGKDIYAIQDNIYNTVKDFVIYKNELVQQYFEKAQQAQSVQNLINPGVETSIIYGNMIQTEKTMQYNQNTKEHFDKHKNFYFPEQKQYTLGDGTVPSYSALIAAFKWAFEYEQKKQEGVKPVHLYEYCSSYVNKKNDLKNNLFSGMKCECWDENIDEQFCQHSCINSDVNVIDFIVQKAIQNYDTKQKAEELNEEQIFELLIQCPAII